MGDIERALRIARTQLALEQQHFNRLLLRVIERLGPIAVELQLATPSHYAQIKPRSFSGTIIPARGDWHREGKVFWDVSPQIYGSVEANSRIHWILFSDGELEKVHYRDQWKHGILRFARLKNSTNVHEYCNKHNSVILNSYLNLRKFALDSGISKVALENLETDMLAPTDLRHLNEVLKQGTDQHVVLPRNRHLERLGIFIY